MSNEIDVSGCEHCKHIYKNGEGECAAYFLENGDSTVSCSEKPNCYYKQLKRLEQENKKLKAKLEKIKEYVNQLEVFTHIKEDLLNIIEGAEDE